MTGSDGEAAVYWGPIDATDNSGDFVLSGPSSSPDKGFINGSSFGIGMHNVTYTAIDEYGNMATCKFEIIGIAELVWKFCPTNIEVDTSPPGNSSLVSWVTPQIAVDKVVGLAVLGPITSPTNGLLSGDEFPVGVTRVLYSVSDVAGTSIDCVFNVSVRDRNVPSFVNCPANATITLKPDESNAT